MRLAFVIAPPQDAKDAGTPSPAAALAGRLHLRGFRVNRIPLTLEFSSDLARAVGTASEGDSILVYLAGTLQMEEGSPVVRVGESEGAVFAVRGIGHLVKERKPRAALFIVDVVHPGADDAFLAAEYVDAVVGALRAREDGIGALVGARSADRPTAEFTTVLLRALDDPLARDDKGGASIAGILARIRAYADGGTRVPSFAHVRGSSDFVLVDAPPEEMPTPPMPLVRPAAASSYPPPTQLDHRELITRGDDAKSRGELDVALTAYKTALMSPGAAQGEPRATVYARIADVKIAQGKPREAELNLEKALEAFPAHGGSFEALLRLAQEAGDFRRVVAIRTKRYDVTGDVGQLVEAAAVLEDNLKDARAAVEMLESARTKAGGDVAVLERLRAIFERMLRWPQVVAVLGDLCRETTSSKARADLRFAQADLALGRMRDEARGLSLLDAALEEDPTHEKAIAALIAVRERREEWASLERAFARLIDRHAERGDAERAWETCKRLGVLRRDRLNDPAGAMEAFAGALRCKPSDVESRAAVADLLMTRGDIEHAKSELEAMAVQAPTRVATHRKLFELCVRTGDRDRAWLVATVLEELKAADMDHELLIDQFRPEPTSAVRPASSLADDAWDGLLRSPGADPAVIPILRAVGKAAIETRVQSLKAQKKLLSLNPQKKQAPTSTVSIVRMFVWASQILNVPLPELYLHEDVPGGLAAVPGEAMTTAIGPAVLSGLPLRELAFLVGRHLSYYRTEHHVLVFFPTLADLSTLFLATASIALPKLESTPAAQKLRGELEKRLSPEDRQALAVAMTHFDSAGGKADLASFIRGVELTATRAGLLLAGDLAIAMGVLRREERAIADLTFDDKRADLLAFCASSGLPKLRKRLGIAAGAPAPPPSSPPSVR